MNQVQSDILYAEDCIERVKRQKLNGVIVAGPPGIGKTRMRKKLDAWYTSRGRAPIYPRIKKHEDLALVIEKAAEAYSPLIFDDQDNVFASRERLNLLKCATDPSEGRRVPFFMFTNEDPRSRGGRLRPHLDALCGPAGRLKLVEITRDREQLFLYSARLALTGELTRISNRGVILDAVKWLHKHAHRIAHLTPRTFENAIYAFASSGDFLDREMSDFLAPVAYSRALPPLDWTCRG